jgi:D-alanyl-D-alanine carboxypeptidase/D-alanyl-D-alanine-endopeptidase (penicillin-binding protein 4)
VIVGRGDPNLSGRVLPYGIKTERRASAAQALEELADQVAARGVRMVDGDILGDDTFYSPQRYAPGWAQDDLQWTDGAPVSALTFNDNVMFVNIQPGERDGDKALVTLDPDPNYFQLDNRIQTTAAGVTRKIGIRREPGSKTIVLWGSIPLGDSGLRETLALEDPAEFTAQLFRTLLEKRGIVITGKTRARHGDIAQFFDEPIAPAGGGGRQRQRCCPSAVQPSTPSPTPEPENQRARCCMSSPENPDKPAIAVVTQVLAQHISLPLIEDVRVTNKISQNLHAELALRLAGKLAEQAGSFEGGNAAVRKFLLGAGLREEEFFFLDGSGLSRRDLVTPAAVTRLLLYAASQPWGAQYEGSLPVGGVDGSLSERFLNSPAAGLVHAKTGTLSHVSALSGYGQTLTGKRFVFSIFCNNYNVPASRVTPAIDAIVKVLVTDTDTAP